MSLCGKSNWPELEDLYPGLWTDVEKVNKQDTISAANFMKFAKLYNTKPNLEEGGKN